MEGLRMQQRMVRGLRATNVEAFRGGCPARGAWMLLVGGESRRGLCAWRVRKVVGVAVGLGCSGVVFAAQRLTAAVKAAVAGDVRAWRSTVLSVVHGEGGCGEVWLGEG